MSKVIPFEIPIPDGFQVDTFDKETGKGELKSIPVKIIDLLNVFDDVLKFHNLKQKTFDKMNTGLATNEVGRREVELIVAAYNNRVVIDFNDEVEIDWRDGQPKRYPIFNMPDTSGRGFSFNDYGCWLSDSDVGSRQVFLGPNSIENLKDAVSKFLASYEKMLTK